MILRNPVCGRKRLARVLACSSLAQKVQSEFQGVVAS